MQEKLIGGRIKRLREKKAWTQEHLAEAAGVSPRTVQRAEEGAMSAETMTALAGALDVAVESLSAPSKTPAGFPRITPALFYADPNAALDWLTRVFGFTERVRIPGPDGVVVHAELELEGGVVMLGQEVDRWTWRSPASLDGASTASAFVIVEDADAHCRHARDAGATIAVEPTDMHGMRRYLAVDLEGHPWWFAAPITE